MPYIDVHCHLDRLKSIKDVVERARDAKVSVIVTSGIDLDSNKKALSFASEFHEVKAVLGLHPLDIGNITQKEINECIKFIKENNKKIIGIGETGIDLKDKTNLDEQKEIFERMIELALELNKPIIVHSRKAEEICIELLEKYNAKKVLMHCFSGKVKLLKRIVDNGWFISIPASIKYSEQFQRNAKEVDTENILCETDSPFLHPDRQMDNEPMNVVESYKMIAKIKGISLKDCEKKIESNFKRLFE